jgi:hypothetical protein
VTDASWRAIQALRATPTGAADRDRQPRRIFTAALNQAEELAVAASDVTYAVRPLLLFYSFNQAGRAIAAAHLKAKAELSRHGLSFTCDPIAILKSTGAATTLCCNATAVIIRRAFDTPETQAGLRPVCLATCVRYVMKQEIQHDETRSHRRRDPPLSPRATRCDLPPSCRAVPIQLNQFRYVSTHHPRVHA